MLPLGIVWAGEYYHYSANRYFSQCDEQITNQTLILSTRVLVLWYIGDTVTLHLRPCDLCLSEERVFTV